MKLAQTQIFDIFDFLVTNVVYYKEITTKKRIQRLVKDYQEGDDDVSIYCLVNSIPPFSVNFEKFQEFIGEPYSYSKHLKPLVEAGLIFCIDNTLDGPYATEKYRGIFDSTTGTVKDYTTNEKFVRFWLGKGDPNKKWIENSGEILKESVLNALTENANYHKMTIEEFIKNGAAANFNEA